MTIIPCVKQYNFDECFWRWRQNAIGQFRLNLYLALGCWFASEYEGNWKHVGVTYITRIEHANTFIVIDDFFLTLFWELAITNLFFQKHFWEAYVSLLQWFHGSFVIHSNTSVLLSCKKSHKSKYNHDTFLFKQQRTVFAVQ